MGSGTDPVEGGALGTAVIDHFRRRGATVVATTHDDALKSFAATTPGVAAAAFGFDPDTYGPTYRLIYGAPGRSLALEIAERLGMPGSVIAEARARQSGRESQLAAHLARVAQELAAVERRQAALEGERAGIESARKDLLARESRLTEREAVLKRRLDDKVNEKLREAKEEVDRIVGRLKQKSRHDHRPRGEAGRHDRRARPVAARGARGARLGRPELCAGRGRASRRRAARRAAEPGPIGVCGLVRR